MVLSHAGFGRVNCDQLKKQTTTYLFHVVAIFTNLRSVRRQTLIRYGAIERQLYCVLQSTRSIKGFHCGKKLE